MYVHCLLIVHFRMGALIGIGALIDKDTFEGGAYWKEGAKLNHNGSVIFFNYNWHKLRRH